MSKLPQLVINERDAVMYEMKKAGATYKTIARHFNVSEATAYRGVERMSKRVAQRLTLDHSAETMLDVARMDDMLRSFLPMTKPQKMKLPDSDEEITIPPSFDAANMVMKIIAQRSKLFGSDSGEALSITVNTGAGAPSTADQKVVTETSPEQEVKELLKVFKDAQIMDPEALDLINSMINANQGDEDIVDVEVVDEGGDGGADEEYNPVALDPAKHVKPSNEPPEIVDEYDEEFPDEGWMPNG
jgi:hypothetical protein